MEAYTGNREEAVRETLEADPVGAALLQMMNESIEGEILPRWEGTSGDLLKRLEALVNEGLNAPRRGRSHRAACRQDQALGIFPPGVRN